MKTSVRFVVAALLLASALQSRAQTQVTERGFKADAVYQLNGFDSVNLFNGNLILTVPLGISYPVSAGLSYSFVLRYAGQVWRTVEICSVSPNLPENCRERYVLEGDDVALGWGLSFGELVEPIVTAEGDASASLWKYRSSDGGDHTFFATLHEPRCAGTVTTNCDTYVADWRFTRDGSYLRLVKVNESTRIVEFPDGLRQQFVKLSDGKWHIRYMYTPFSAASASGVPTRNYVQFDWNDSTKVWTITDSRGRSHTVTFGTSAVTLSLAAFDNHTASYTLSKQDISLKRPCDAAPNAPAVSTALLNTVTLASGESYSFQYDAPTTTCSNTSGSLTQATLPTLGKINWTYNTVDYHASDTAIAVSQKVVLDSSNTPISKTVYTVTGGQTTVDSYASFSDNSPDVRTVHYFQGVDTSTTFGLPFSTLAMSGTVPNPDNNTLPVPQQRWLSSITYECNPSSWPATCTAERAQYVRYEADSLAGSSCDYSGYPCWTQRNRRSVSDRTLYVTDGNRYADVNYGSFDGLGHYREVKTDGNFGQGDKKTTFTNYNPAVGTYTLTSSAGRGDGYVGLSAASPWILNTFTDGYTEEEGVSRLYQAYFDPGTGFLNRKRIFAGSSRGSHDLLAVFTPDAVTQTTDIFGYVGREEYFGGDWQTVSTDANLKDLSLPAHDSFSFRIDHTYSSSTETAKYVKPDGNPMAFLSSDVTIDANTGLVSASRDAAGLATTYLYDVSGRLTILDPPGMAATGYSYFNATASAPAYVLSESGSVDAKISRQYTFDAVGRLFQEKRLGSSGDWSTRETVYDGLGRKVKVSEEETTPSHWTEFLDYDAFGRARSVKAPDASITSFTYSGERQVTRETQGGGTVPVTIRSVETRDRLGRLREVREKSGPQAEEVTTSYWYDASDRLTAVKMNGIGNQVQDRVFDYDGRGFCRWETQPESGMKTFTYDARGHVVTSELGAAKTTFDLQYAYDPAERLVTLSSRNPASLDTYHVIKEFTYAEANVGASGQNPADYRKGKLLTAARYNYPSDLGPSDTLGTIFRVTETYAYKDDAGHVTHRDTLIEAASGGQTPNLALGWSPARTITQSFSYDDLGQPSAVAYPMCINCGTPDGAPAVNVTSTHEHGELTHVFPMVQSINYWPNGMRHQLVHVSGVVDTQTLDTSGMARPGSISFGTYQTCTPPVIANQTLGAVIGSNEPGPLLSVTVTGNNLHYQWYRVNAGSPPTSIANETGSTYAAPASEQSYFVEVWNDCRIVRSQTIAVKVGGCVDPWLIAGPDAKRNADGTYTLSATAYGSGTLNYLWKRSSDNVVVGTTASIVLSVGATTTYTVTITNSCGGAGIARDVRVVIPLAPSSFSLSAQATGPTSILVSWNAVPGATSYTLQRWSDATGFIDRQAVTGTQFSDTGLDENHVYIYRVKVAGSSTDVSYPDIATTIPFSALSTASFTAATEFTQVLSGINKVRGLLGWPELAWSNILSSAEALPEPGSVVQARHLTALRARLNEALQAAGVPINGYTDADLQSKIIQLVHITELQDRLR